MCVSVFPMSALTLGTRLRALCRTPVHFKTACRCPLWTGSGSERLARARRGACRCVRVLALSFYSGPVLAMAARTVHINLDSASADWEQAKKALLSASLQERKAFYRVPDALSLRDVPVWAPSGPTGGKPHYSVHPELNSKISLFKGDITRLEIDGIVNAAKKTLLGGGGVDGSIHRAAGPLLKKECATLGGCETGQAKITGGYGLPAKYVIHTVGPIIQGSVSQQQKQSLRDCYRNGLDIAVQNQLRTVAFPCISTGVYGYPPAEAVDVALATVREYLEEHHAQLDRVIFCVFLQSDEELYRLRLPLYFPHAG